MVSKTEPDCPPRGWKVQTKVKNGRKYKCYINSKTRQKFYSKLAMLRFIKDGGKSTGKSQHINENSKKTFGEKQMQLVKEDTFEWLPTGWVVERRFRKSGARVGEEYKCFIDPSTGSKFFSKPEVLRHLGSKQRNAGFSSRKDKGASVLSPSRKSVASPNADKSNLEAKVSKTSVQKSRNSSKLKVIVEKTIDKELPSGWIKETRIKMLGNKVVRRYLAFTNPSSRWVFQSKLDALRYIETGEISRHAYRRRIGNITGDSLAITKSSSRNEDTAKRKSRKQSIEVPSKTGVQKNNSDKKTRTSFNSVNDSQHKVNEKKPQGMIRRTRSSFQVVDVQDTSSTKNESFSVPLRVIFPEENPLAVVNICSDKKVFSTSKRKKDGNPPCAPLRSSKRLAGVNTEVLFLDLPIEHVLRATNRKHSKNRRESVNGYLEIHRDVDGKVSRRESSITKPLPSLESVPKELRENCDNVDSKILNDGVCEISRRRSSRNKPLPSLESVPKELHENHNGVDRKILNEGEFEASRRKSAINKPLPISESIPKESHENNNNVELKISIVSELSRRKSPRINPSPSLEIIPKELHENPKDVDIEILSEGVCEASRRKSSRKNPSSNLEIIPIPKEVNENPKEVDAKISNEGVCEASRRKSSRIKPLPSLEAVPKELHENRKDVDVTILNKGTRKASRRQSSRLKPLPTLKSVPKELNENENHQDVDTKILNKGVIKTTNRRKSSRSQLIPCSKSTRGGLHGTQQGVDKEIVLVTREEQSLTGINDLNFQEEYHENIDGGEKIVVDIQAEQPLTKTDTKSTSLEKQHHRLGQKDSEMVSFYKIEDFPSREVELHTLNFDTQTVIAIQGEPSTKIGDLKTKRPLLVDLNELQMEAPPGFSGNTKFGTSTTTTVVQPVDRPIGTAVRNTVENVSKRKSTLEDQSREQIMRTEKQTEQSQSELSLWSDPCLEFAYKTLTGAIPLDDNLAIEDYIQHQLRTSESNPEIYPPGFFRNNESKLVSPLPEDVNFLNTNSFESQDLNQVKKNK